MSNGDDPARRYVTNGELQDQLRSKPNNWEVRFLILAAIIANQVLPSASIAKAVVTNAIGSIGVSF